MSKQIEYLVISNRNDFTSDYICLNLKKYHKLYLRINRDDFTRYKFMWDICNGLLFIKIDGCDYVIDNSLKAVYYRAPVYIRYYEKATCEEQLYKSQWMAFIKNLMYFDKALWINHPAATYKAENKMLQLKYAKEVGFFIPQTWVTNNKWENVKENVYYAVKSIDTLLLRHDNKEAFLYTNILKGKEINKADLALAPIVIQEFLNPKVDIRVTVVGNRAYTALILKDGKGMYGDWRKVKDEVTFVKHELPADVENKCIFLVKKLGLIFGGIDLALVNGKYYFIEINPTGEWAWLAESVGFDIDRAISMKMIEESYEI